MLPVVKGEQAAACARSSCTSCRRARGDARAARSSSDVGAIYVVAAVAARCRLRGPGGPPARASTSPERAIRFFTFSNIYLARCSRPLPSTPSSAPPDAAGPAASTGARRSSDRAPVVARRGRRRSWPASRGRGARRRRRPRVRPTGRGARSPTPGVGDGRRRRTRLRAAHARRRDACASPTSAARRWCSTSGRRGAPRAARSSRCCARPTGPPTASSRSSASTPRTSAATRRRSRATSAPTGRTAFDPDGAVAESYGVRGLPQTFFIGADGTDRERVSSASVGGRRSRRRSSRRSPPSLGDAPSSLLPAEPAGRGERRGDRPRRRAPASSPTSSDAPGVEHAAHALRQRRGGQERWATASSASGSRSSGYAIPPRNSSSEEQAVGDREVRLGAQRARHQHPDARRTRRCRCSSSPTAAGRSARSATSRARRR